MATDQIDADNDPMYDLEEPPAAWSLLTQNDYERLQYLAHEIHRLLWVYRPPFGTGLGDAIAGDDGRLRAVFQDAIHLDVGLQKVTGHRYNGVNGRRIKARR